MDIIHYFYSPFRFSLEEDFFNYFFICSQIRLDFKNLYGYYIGNTFVPSLFLVVIVYLTFYFDTDDFEVRIPCLGYKPLSLSRTLILHRNLSFDFEPLTLSRSLI